jgi:hypothetical protein
MVHYLFRNLRKLKLLICEFKLPPALAGGWLAKKKRGFSEIKEKKFRLALAEKASDVKKIGRFG